MILDTNGQPILDTIHHCDALDLLRALPDGCVDLICTDPPYNVSQEQSKISLVDKYNQHNRDISLDYGEWDYGASNWHDYIDDMFRVLKSNGVLIMFHEKAQLGLIADYLQKQHNAKMRHIGAWVKPAPPPQMRKVKWQSGLECFLVITKNHGIGHHFNWKLGQSPDYYVCHTEQGNKRNHPTQKPIELIRWIVAYWSFEGDVILDPFVGSGTVAHAAYQLDRHYICGDSDDGYVAIARKRLADANAMLDKVVSETHTQLSLFG